MANSAHVIPFWALFGIGLAFLGFAGIAALLAVRALGQIRRARHWPARPATVADLEISEGPTQTRARQRVARSATVTLRFTDDKGRPRQVRYHTAQSTRLDTRRFQPGATLPVLVNPASPEDFRLSLRPDTGETIVIVATLAFGGAGLALLTLAFI